MSEEDKLIQQELVEEIMKASEEYPNAILYMETLMKDYERLEQENKRLKQELTDYKERNKKVIKLVNLIEHNLEKYEEIGTEEHFDYALEKTQELKNNLDKKGLI